MIDLRRLQVLRVLHQHGTVTAAAAALNLTPSAVSQQIRQLSRDVGVELLLHEGRRVRLTPAAHTLLAHADTLRTQWERALGDLAAHKDAQAGLLRFCGFPTGLAALVVPAASRLRAAHPRLDLRMMEADAHQCFDLLLTGDADIAVVVVTPDAPPLDDARFDQRPLVNDPLDLVVPVDHPLADRESVELAEAACDDWIVPVGEASHRQVILAACAAAGFAPRITHNAKEWPAVIALVSNGFGICLIPRLAPLPAHSAVVRIPLSGDPTPARRIASCVRRGSHDQPAIAHGLAALDEVARPLPPELVPPGPIEEIIRAAAQPPHRHSG
ncbi:LysR family transcriptional regulator [Actinomadura sp. SCN-SB]|uniref:LysR family transcriptional regulator n=1 Tax=Actinomadura sp. SCN-SB TaxID=3373092 RepID=UPI0037537383